MATNVSLNLSAPLYSLTVSRTGTGSGTVTSVPAGINCGTTCSANFTFNTSVDLSAAPSSGSTFTGWSGACTGTGACTVTMDQSRSVSAAFTLSTVPDGLTCTTLDPKPATASTGEKPQSKVWNYGGSWYAVFPTNTSGASSAGTWLWKLAGTTWTEVLKLSNRTDTKADVKVAGTIAHILLFADSNTQYSTVEFVAGTYQLWSTRTSLVGISLPGSEIATIDQDFTGRLWLATRNNNNTGEIVVYYSDTPYSTWNGPVVLATGVVANDDIAVVTALPNGTVGVLWANETTKYFGFKVHVDGANPTTWSADELPASQSFVPGVGLGMADDHLNVAVASDSTLYAAVKTSYDTAGYPKMAFLVRRPSGTWDNLYGVDEGGTRPLILLDEVHGVLTYIYTSSEGYNPIIYRQSSTSSINFSGRTTLRSSSFNDVSSMKANYNGEFVVIYASASEVAGQLCTGIQTSGADLAITKSDAKSTVHPNELSTYTITVANNGPQAVTGATVSDVLPSALTNASWTCSASSGASCAASGSGNISDTVTLPAAGTVTYTLLATVDIGASGSVVNTATVTAPGGISDPNQSNNSAIDTDTIIVSSSPCGADPTLVGCWQMEENGGSVLVDGSSYLNDASLIGSPAWTAGIVGSYALDLNGTSQYGVVTDDSSLRLDESTHSCNLDQTGTIWYSRPDQESNQWCH